MLFYGTGGGKFDKTDTVFFGHFAGNHQWGVHPKKVDALADRIRSIGQDATFYTYPGAEHWFAESDWPEYDRKVAELAWKRTTEYVLQELG